MRVRSAVWRAFSRAYGRQPVDTHSRVASMTGQTEDQGPGQAYGHYKLHSAKVLLAHTIFITDDRKMKISDLCHN